MAASILKVGAFKHITCRNNIYPKSTVQRFPVPDDFVFWSAEYGNYSPPIYTASHINGQPWADPDIGSADFQPKWNQLDGAVNRVSFNGIYKIENGLPINPIGRTGLSGRGLLGRWGPNHAADPVVTRWKRNADGNVCINIDSQKKILQMVAIQRQDNNMWAIPGGMVDPGEKVSATLKREFMEEALDSFAVDNTRFGWLDPLYKKRNSMRVKLLENIYKTFRFKYNHMAVFTQVVNPLTGLNEWAVHGDDYDYDTELTCTGFGDMLHDKERNQKYFAALRSAIAHMHADGRKAHVLDIGTGTGILSMMALTAGADTVTACEAFLPMANCAERIFAANGFGDKVRLIKKRSTEIRIGEDMPQRANLLVAELLDTELIGEGAISIYNHAHNELLTDDVICIPSKATCYAQVVQSPLATQWNTMKIVADLDGNILLKPPRDVLQCKSDAAVHDVQLSQLSLEHFLPLTQPKEIFEFDFNSKSNRPVQRQQLLELIASQPGSTDLIFYWWDINMYSGDNLVLSCAPYWAHPDYKTKSDTIPWRDHWMQAIYYIPTPQHISRAGEKFVLSCNHDEYSLWFDVHTTLKLDAAVSRHACTCNLHLAYPRSRIGQMNQSVRNKKYLSYLENNLTKDSHVLCIGDGCVLGVAAAKMGVASVILCENHYFSKRFVESVVESNDIKNVEFVENINSLPEAKLSKLTHIFGEPYFFNAILPWDNFQFGNILQSNLEKVSPTVKIAPHSAKVYAVPVQFTDLHKIRTPVQQCEGFDLRLFDRMIKHARAKLPDHRIEAQPLWEYPCKALAQPQNILNVDFRNFQKEQCSNGDFQTESDGTCNGVALWVEWNIDGGSGSKSIVSTGPVEPVVPGKFIKWDMFVRQGVQLFEKAYPVINGKSSILWTLQHKPKCNKLELDFNVNA